MFAIIALALLAPLYVSWPFLRVSLNTNELSQVYAVCQAVPKNAAILFLDQDGFEVMPTIKSYCGMPGEWLKNINGANMKEVAMAARSKGYEPYVLIVEQDIQYIEDKSQSKELKLISTVNYQEAEKDLDHPPRHTITADSTLYMAKIGKDGRLESMNGK